MAVPRRDAARAAGTAVLRQSVAAPAPRRWRANAHQSNDTNTGISLYSSGRDPAGTRRALVPLRIASVGEVARQLIRLPVPWGWGPALSRRRAIQSEEARGRRQHHDTVGSASQLRAVPRSGPFGDQDTIGPTEWNDFGAVTAAEGYFTTRHCR